jgi:4-amino-4-deoxy-L-arabinose transferase-like glycosyltransferase
MALPDGYRGAGLVAFARQSPGRALAIVLGLHLFIWTILPILASPNLQLDLAEDLALGKEWQLSYWKHPPLPWWLADLAYRITGQTDIVYLLGPLAAVVCFYGVWRLAREITTPTNALIAVFALTGIHYYNFSVVKFAHDQMQLPFWAFAALFFYRAIARQKATDWLAAGALLALCFWSKYAAFALAGSFGLFLLFDPTARQRWRTPGPYLMALAFAVVLAPNIYGLVQTEFMPFRYVDARAKTATHWYHYVTFPLQWTLGQIGYVLPAIGLFGLLYARAARQPATVIAPDPAFARRYVTMLALGPFLVTTAVALAAGRLPVAMWGYPLWSFAPLAAVVWFGTPSDERRLAWFARGFVALFVAIPIIYAAVQWGEPLVRKRARASDFPGQAFTQAVTKAWQEQTGGAPLVYVAGSEFAVNNVAVYAASRPHVVVHGEPKLSPWIDMADLGRRGVLLVWEDGHAQANLDEWNKTFPGMRIGPLLEIPQQTLRPIPPARLRYAIVPPRP